ncbi:MAG: glycosyltransferase family 4 protein [Candidatus Krumholzibacteriota bacterium]|nr:glycosyltransferase family 4 protein [Candidatus Krumholzibacteriota bacterium]
MASFVFATLGTTGALYRYFSLLAGELAARGHRAALLLDGRRRDLVAPAGNPAIFSWPSASPTRLADARFLHRLIHERRVDCLVGNFTAVNLCMIVGRLDCVPARVAWGHTLTSQIRMDTAVAGVKRRLLDLRRRAVLCLATRIVANSAATREDLMRSYGVSPARIEVLHFVLPDPLAGSALPRGRSIVYAGRLAPSKGVDVLVRAIPDVVAAHPETTFEIAGDGPERAALERLADSLGVPGACRFHGAVSIDRVYELMAAAAVQVSPSIHEAFGLVNLEAHAVGTPVVASDTGGIPAVVADGETGLLVPPGDPAALAAAVNRLLGDDALREQMGRAARRRYEERFGPDRIGRHADLFEGFLRNPRETGAETSGERQTGAETPAGPGDGHGGHE